VSRSCASSPGSSASPEDENRSIQADSTQAVIAGDGEFVAFTHEIIDDSATPVFGEITLDDQVLISPTSAPGTYGLISALRDGVTPAECGEASFCNFDPAIDGTGRNVGFASLANPLELDEPTPSPDPSIPSPPNGFTMNVYVRYRPPVVALSPPAFDYGQVPIGSSSTATFTLTNTGLSSFDVDQLLIGTANPALAVTPGPGTGCTAGTPVLAGQSCTITVTYTPQSTDALSPNEVVTVSEPPTRFQSVSTSSTLAGRGTDSPLVINPTPDDFGGTNIGSTSPPRTYTITNVANLPIDVTTVVLGGSNPGEYTIVNDTCTGVTLPLNGTCTVEVLFTPAGPGARPTQLEVTGIPQSSSTSGTPVTAIGSITGTGIEIFSLTIAPAPFDFGLIRIGTQSVGRTFTITNQGNVPNTVSAGVLGGANAGEFLFAPNGCNVALPVNGSCTVTVAFAPSSGGNKTATVRVDGQSGSFAEAGLTGRGGVVALAFAPNSLTYGATLIGADAPNQATVLRNIGDLSVQLGAVTVAGANAADFALAANTCTAGLTLPAGGSCTVTVRFRPGAAGARTATLTATGTPAVAASAALSGTGTAPAPTNFLLDIQPSPADFGQLVVGQVSPPRTLTVRNPGTTANTIGSINLSGPDAAQFQIATNACAGVSLAPGATCSVTVTYNPTDSGTRVAAVVAIGTGGSSATATLTGQSLFQPTLTIGPDVARPGQVVTITGTDFPPNQPIQMFFRDSPGLIFTTVTGPDGSFNVPALLSGGGPVGPRELLVVDVPGRFLSVPPAPILVTSATVSPQDNFFSVFIGEFGFLSRG
jgi:hypothetical protein